MTRLVLVDEDELRELERRANRDPYSTFEIVSAIEHSPELQIGNARLVPGLLAVFSISTETLEREREAERYWYDNPANRRLLERHGWDARATRIAPNGPQIRT